MSDKLYTQAELTEKLAGLLESFKRTLQDHWTTIVCNHEEGTDTPICSCSEWHVGPLPTVGDAVKEWIEHVAAQLPNEQADAGIKSIEAPLRQRIKELEEEMDRRYECGEQLAGMREIAAHLAEITIAILPHGGDYRAEEVNELLARQREIIAKRIREAM